MAPSGHVRCFLRSNAKKLNESELSEEIENFDEDECEIASFSSRESANDAVIDDIGICSEKYIFGNNADKKLKDKEDVIRSNEGDESGYGSKCEYKSMGSIKIKN